MTALSSHGSSTQGWLSRSNVDLAPPGAPGSITRCTQDELAQQVPTSRGWATNNTIGAPTPVSSATLTSYTQDALARQQAVAQAQADMQAQQAQQTAAEYQQALATLNANHYQGLVVGTANLTGITGNIGNIPGMVVRPAGVAYVSTDALAFVHAGPITAPSTDAINRSMELLYDWLNPEQRKQLALKHYFEVVGGHTGIRYRLTKPDVPYSVHELQHDGKQFKALNKICFGPEDKTLPVGDIWLTQKLALELDERETLKIANRSPIYYDSPAPTEAQHY